MPGAWSFGAPNLVVPSGFTIARVVPTNALRYPMFATFDDRGRLFVAESSGKDLYAELQRQTRECRVSVLADADGDGHFEQSRVFADKLVFPMGLAWRDGKLYVADPPDLVVLTDTDGDGRADKREVLLSGFGHTDNGSLHGLMFGPDGWLYLTMGQPDGYHLKRPDGSVIEGKSGALLRCRPDGSDVQRLARGFENLVEIVFLPSGEIIGTDNWFHLPQDGVRDALVHVLPGGVYPLNVHARSESHLFFTGELLPALAAYPAVALSGLVHYEGSAFPAEMSGDLFSAQFKTRKVVRHKLQRHSSTFTSTDADFLTTDDPDFHPSDVLEDADGSLLVVDTGAWYVHHCPTGRIREAPALGGLWRVRWRNAKPLFDPGGLRIDWANAKPGHLAELLGDARPAVRERARELLVKQNAAASETLVKALNSAAPRVAKENALWAATRLLADKPQKPDFSFEMRRRLEAAAFKLLLGDNPDLVALAARTLRNAGNTNLAASLEPMLAHAAPHVRLAAAEGLAACGRPASVGPLLKALDAAQDAFLDHALTFALHHCASREQLASTLSSENPRAQKAALVLLDQPPHRSLEADAVISRLFASDDALRRAAQSILRGHPEWKQQVEPVLQTLLNRSALDEHERTTLQEFLLSFELSPDLVNLVGERTAATNTPAFMRVLLLDVMAQKPRAAAPETWRNAVAVTLRERELEVLAPALRAAHSLKPNVDSELKGIARDAALPIGLRLEALRAGARKNAPLASADFALLLDQLNSTNAPALRLASAELLGAATLNDVQLTHFLNAVRLDRLLSPATILAAASTHAFRQESGRAVLNYLQSVSTNGGSVPPALLETLRLPREMETDFKSVSEEFAKAEARQGEQLTTLEPLLRGGDPNRGHELFLHKSGCAACHRVGKQGGLLGPDLTRIGTIRSGRDLLESLVLPSATFAQGYETFSVSTRAGDLLTGIQVRQLDGSFVLRDATGAETRLAADQIEKVERRPISLMPEGLLAPLSRDEIRDLLAYLQNLK